MNITEARRFAKFRLFRPLAFPSAYHPGHATDAVTAERIARWCSKVLLGGNHYDLQVEAHGVFQVQSNRVNRASYLIPVWDPVLVRKIVLAARHKTPRATRGCGLGKLEGLDYLGGILVLNRVLFRGTKRYRDSHESKTGWFVEDRYHLDVFVWAQRERKGEEPDEPVTPRFEPLLRVFHDSVGCLATERWSAGPDVDVHNESIKRYTPEYFPDATEIVMSWHELAEHLGVGASGVYALSNYIASELARGMNYLAVNASFFWGETAASQTADLSRADDTLWTAPGQPLANDLTRNYQKFFTRRGTDPTPQYVKIDTYSRTALFQSNLSLALVSFLLAKANGGAEYLGHGFFRLRAPAAIPLAAGTGNWGSAENSEIGISTQGGGQAAPEGAAGSGNVEGGIARLVIDGLRYAQKEEIEAAIIACRSNTSADCQECVEDSIGDTYHDLGVAADIVDVIGGIAACVLTIIYAPPAAPYVCGVTLPAAGNAAKDFWENVVEGYDYAEDMCSGLPDATNTFGTPSGGQGSQGDQAEKQKEAFEAQCRQSGGTPVVERIQRADACLGDARAICMNYSRIVDASKRLTGAVCKPGSEDTSDEVICVWCISGFV